MNLQVPTNSVAFREAEKSVASETHSSGMPSEAMHAPLYCLFNKWEAIRSLLSEPHLRQTFLEANAGTKS